MEVKKLDDFDFNNKKVLIRTDYNVPVDNDGNITDSMRIEESAPTIKYLLQKGARQLIILTHVGRPKEREENLKTDKMAEKLSEILENQVKKIDDWGENGIPENRIVMLENVRFNSFEKSKDETERDKFAEKICANADIFVMEAFSNMHRGKQASMTSTLKYLPACLGKACETEISTIQGAVSNPQRPLVSIIGGLKADKLSSVEKIMENADKVLLGGALAFSVLYKKGYAMGKSKIDYENLDNFSETFEKIKDSAKLLLPEDAIVADELTNSAETRVVSIDEVGENDMALDLGPKTIEKYEKELDLAGTIIWNGPIGAFEFEPFVNGTKAIAQKIADSEAESIIGGGDSGAAIHKFGLGNKVSFISSGGGASLFMFEGKVLPVLEQMKENSERFIA